MFKELKYDKNHFLNIYHKQINPIKLKSKDKKFPEEFTKILNWFNCENSKHFTVRYNETIYILDRETISFIQANMVNRKEDK